MTKLRQRTKQFWSELRRRKTVQTAVAYLILLVAAVGPSADILEGLGAPEWVFRYIVIGLFAGFPIVLILSWVFDFTLHGVTKTKDLSDEIEHDLSGIAESQPDDIEVAEILRLESAKLGVPIDLSEKRLVSVFSCSISSSTNGKDDPELLLGFIERLDSELNEIVDRYEGNRLASGRNSITVSFGFPVIHEDDTRRAARTAIQIMELITQQKIVDSPNSRLVVRGGIHTETIIVEEGSAKEDAIAMLGETISTSEFLNTLAPENSISVSSESQHILKQFFLLDETQQITHPKLGESAPVFNLGVRLSSQLQNIMSQQSDVYGRENEQRLLLQQWQAVLEGESEFVLIKGEAGIGKSSLLVSTIKQILATEIPQIITLDCEPYYQSSPLRPVITHLERTIYRDEHDLDHETRLQKLREFLEPLSIADDEELALLAVLLSIKVTTLELTLNDSEKLLREKTQGALVNLIHAAAEVQPVVLVVEDVHWADSSTLALIELIISETPEHRIFGVFTARPELESHWGDLSHVMELNLHKLNSRVASEMIRQQAGSQSIPDTIVDQIVEVSNGVPLYIEQLTEALLESNPGFEASSVETLEIPTSLAGSLAVRISNLGAAKPLFQLCAVIGYEFPYRLLVEVCETEDENLLRSVLKNIVDAGLLYQKGVYPDAVFKFRHRLIMEVASKSLLKKTRRKLHAVIAQSLEASFPEVCANRPTQLAHHYAEAGDAEKAIDYWIKAARRAQLRFANEEVILQVDHGLKLLEMISDEDKANNFEISLQNLRGEAYLVSKGYTNPEVQASFERAVALAGKVDQSPELYMVVVGLWMHYVIRGDYQRSLLLSKQLTSIANSINKEPELLQQDYCKGFTNYYLGNIDQSIENFLCALVHNKPGLNYTRQNPSHDDVRIMLNSLLGLAQWATGDSKAAEESMLYAIKLARELDQPYGIVRALYYSSLSHLMRGESADAAKQAQELLAISAEKGFSMFVLLGSFIAATAIPDDEERLQALIRPMDILIGTGARNGITFLLTIIIDECIRQKNWPKAQEYLKLNEQFTNEQEEYTYLSETLRLKAIVQNQIGKDEDKAAALQILQQGIDHALKVNNKPFALRCGLTFVELSDESEVSVAKLRNIVECFPLPDDTPDYQRAAELIGQ